MRTLIALLAFALTAGSAPAQSIQDRLKALEDNTAKMDAVVARLAALEAKVDALAGKAPTATGSARIMRDGYEWEWDKGLGVYRPTEPGWTYVAERNVWRQSAPQMQSSQPMFQGGACAGGSCGAPARGRRR